MLLAGKMFATCMEWDQARVIFYIAMGGAIGATLRYLVSGWVTRGDFPWGTFAVNIIGSFLLAFLFFLTAQGTELSGEARAFLFVGIFGAFTTMSTFSLETINLAAEGERLWALGNVVINAGLCVSGAYAGRAFALALGG